LLKTRSKLKAGVVAIAALVALTLVPTGASANCGGGGLTPAEVDICTPTAKARLLPNGMLIPPKSAPARIQAVIAAANQIRTKPYVWGGGHGRWWDRGYDCSGSVSYALHGGEFLESPLPSGPMERWGLEGEGRWITVYANAGHAFMVVAGWRFDTVALSQGGTRWTQSMTDTSGYVARHPPGL
jgi:hypothetical protein